MYVDVTTANQDLLYLQVVVEVVEVMEAAASAIPPEVPASGEVVVFGDDSEPLAAEVNPAGTKVSAQEEDRTSLAGGSRAVLQRASPGKTAPTVKPLRLVGKPSLKL